ncbi:hypothetical protein EJ06DRAFT_546038 [Trichodelitschia bisporula]|uniref:DUF8021 domain-containing protein n=1 Tax=Trichodelitschia bisporula TaxID=703511 RepID=A0A6G1IBC3_9PEZI|nr:hypothetical protein EJ06DRAFT_546038 [Trichodelitschia bisporula]
MGSNITTYRPGGHISSTSHPPAPTPKRGATMHPLTPLLFAPLAAAACSRSALTSARDAFFAAGSANSTAPLATNAKITLNNAVTPLASTPFTSLTNFTPFLAQAVDEEGCQIATMRVSPSQVLSTRLGLNVDGKIAEVEFLQAVQGDQFFRPSGFPSKQPEIYDAPQTPGPPPIIPPGWTPAKGTPKAEVNTATCKPGSGPARALTRTELIYTANTYADGLGGAPWDSCLLGGSPCPRLENGVQTTGECGVGAGSFGFGVFNRRFVADTLTGVVLGQFWFEYSGARVSMPTRLYLHEYFKVDAARLRYVLAPMKGIPKAQAAAEVWKSE